MNFFTLQAIIIFIFSVGNDWLSVIWHEAREKRKQLRGAIVGVLLGLVAWLSAVWVIRDSTWLMVPDLLGTFIGSYFAIKKQKRKPKWENVLVSPTSIKVTPAGIIMRLTYNL